MENHPYVLSRSPTAPPGSLTPNMVAEALEQKARSLGHTIKVGNSRVQWR